MAGINNADGLNDIVVSASSQGDGQVWIIDGTQTGTLTLGATTGFITRITGGVIPDQVDGFGRGVVNPAETTEGDVNGDGMTDLVVTGGFQNTAVDDIRVHVWYGGRIPTGAIDSSTADYFIQADSSFQSQAFQTQPPPNHLTWVGDTNGDGLNDLLWSDHSVGGPIVPPATEPYANEGAVELLWDDGI